MRIKKIFNNNAILAVDTKNREVVAMGSGIGFKRSVGEILEEKSVEKVFILKEKEISERVKLLFEDIPSEIIELGYDIIEYAKNILDSELNDYIYVTLTDHINSALILVDENLIRPNGLLWEIKKMYPKEFAVGLKAIEFIEMETGKELPEDEAGNIALHLINAQITNTSDNVEEILNQTKMVQDILNIVKYTYNIEINEKSLAYERFVTHLRFFFKRLLNRNMDESNDNFLLDQVKTKYKSAYNCMLKVEKYLSKDLSDEEKLYLTLHIQRVTTK